MAKHLLNVEGEFCPVPLLKTEKKFKELNIGDVLVVETDHTQAVRNIANWASRAGYEIEIDELDNGLWQLTITKTDA